MTRGRAPSPRPRPSSSSARSAGSRRRRLGLQLHAHAEHLGRVAQLGGHRLGQRVGVGHLVLAQVDHGQHRLVGEQEGGAQVGPLLGGERRPVERRAPVQRPPAPPPWPPPRRLERRVVPGHLPALGELRLDRVDVGQHQLELEGVQVVEGVGAAHHVVVLEGPQHQHDGVDLADAGQEAVAQALARRRPGHQPGDVDELEGGRHDLLRLAHLGQRASAGGRAPGRCRPWLSVVENGWAATGADAAGQGVEQRRLAGVGQADEAETFHRTGRCPGGSSPVPERLDPATAPRLDCRNADAGRSAAPPHGGGGNRVAWHADVEEDEQAQDQGPAQEGQPRQEAERRSLAFLRAAGHAGARRGRGAARHRGARPLPVARRRRLRGGRGLERRPRTPAPGRCSTRSRSGPRCTAAARRCCRSAWSARRRWPATGCSPSSGRATRTRPCWSCAPRSIPTPPPRVVVDPHGMAADHAASIDWFTPSPDGRLRGLRRLRGRQRARHAAHRRGRHRHAAARRDPPHPPPVAGLAARRLGLRLQPPARPGHRRRRARRATGRRSGGTGVGDDPAADELLLGDLDKTALPRPPSPSTGGGWSSTSPTCRPAPT